MNCTFWSSRFHGGDQTKVKRSICRSDNDHEVNIYYVEHEYSCVAEPTAQKKPEHSFKRGIRMRKRKYYLD